MSYNQNETDMYNYNSIYFKKAARMQLTGQWGAAALLTFVYMIIIQSAGFLFSMSTDLCFTVPGTLLPYVAYGMAESEMLMISNFLILLAVPLVVVLDFLYYFLMMPMYYSYSVMFLENRREGKELNPGKLFKSYSQLKRVGGTMLLMSIYTSLWSLLLYIPGIVKSISYSQTAYVLRDNPGLSYNAAIERSMDMMYGYKMRYFKLLLSFIGWILLAALTCGIAIFWVYPYMQAANANFYEYVKEEYEKKVAAAE